MIETSLPLAGQQVLGYGLSGTALLCFSCAVLATKAASKQLNLELGFFITLIVNVLIAGVALGAWAAEGTSAAN